MRDHNADDVNLDDEVDKSKVNLRKKHLLNVNNLESNLLGTTNTEFTHQKFSSTHYMSQDQL